MNNYEDYASPHKSKSHEIICALWVQPFKNVCSLNSPRMKGKTKKEKQLFFTEVKILQNFIYK